MALSIKQSTACLSVFCLFALKKLFPYFRIPHLLSKYCVYQRCITIIIYTLARVKKGETQMQNVVFFFFFFSTGFAIHE